MLKARTKTYSDVSSFLNKDKSSKSFVSYTVGKKAVGGVRVFFVSFVILFLMFALLGDSFKQLVIAGVSEAHSFALSTEHKLLKTDDIFLASISPLLSVKSPPKPEQKKAESHLKPNITVKKATSNGIDIKNETDYNIDIPAILNEKISISTQNPKVLIVHTHGSESYTASDKYQYTASANYRTQDTKYNVIRVGEEIAKALRKKGIDVIHDRSINDYPSYNDSYNKTGEKIEKHLADDKDIVFVFDIHRDAVGEGDNIVKFVSDVKGKKSAQIMMVCGTDVNLSHPHWKENLRLAVHVQNNFEDNYPGLFRPLNLRKERFNMHLSKGSILFEMGTNGNTLDEALASAKFLGEGLGDIINDLCIKNY